MTATNSTPSASAAAAVRRTKMPTASVTTWMTAWVPTTHVASATAPATSTNADVRTSLKALRLRRQPARRPRCAWQLRGRRDADGICDDVDDCVVPTTRAACAMAQVRSTNADVRTSRRDCDCNGNLLDALGICGGDCTADADADGICDDVTTAWVHWTRAAYATAQVRSTNADVRTSLKETATATATSSTSWRVRWRLHVGRRCRWHL